jgi:hypothetical protein
LTSLAGAQTILHYLRPKTHLSRRKKGAQAANQLPISYASGAHLVLIWRSFGAHLALDAIEGRLEPNV